MSRIVVTHALRTPIGKFMGTLSGTPAVDLGASVVGDLLKRSGIDPADVGSVVFGHARQAGNGPNTARQVAVKSGIPVQTPAYTVNMACASGMKAVDLAAGELRSGLGPVFVAGGMESMSRVPFLLDRMRDGYRLGHGEIVDGMYRDGFLCPMAEMVMGETAEDLGKRYGIPREKQDRFALESQEKAEKAWAAGAFAEEISPVRVPGKKKGTETVFDRDEHPRAGTTLESLSKLPPVFDPKEGAVTAGNSSGITDGAAALLLMTEEEARRRGLAPLGAVEGSAAAGVHPKIMGLGPVPATLALLKKTGRKLEDFDLIELNEAFAAQVIACEMDLKLPRERLNVNGGAIALGHPIGCTGARILVTLLHALRARGLRRGLATLCVSGGMGYSMSLAR